MRSSALNRSVVWLMQWGCLCLHYSDFRHSQTMLLGGNKVSGSEGSLATTSTYPCFGDSVGGAF